MALTGKRIFVGFGFGAIQAGLFLFEAYRSGKFRRLVVAEVLPEVVRAVRQAGGYYSVNVAHGDRVEAARIGPVEIENPAVEADRRRLIEAVAEAEEMATAVPSVEHYVSDTPGSVHRILGLGLRKKAALGGARAILYAAENHNHAAEILERGVAATIPEAELPLASSRLRTLNTVIGKMSGVVAIPRERERRGLAPIAPGLDRAFLVEAFNRILISRVCFDPDPKTPPFSRGIEVFQEKEDLLPFEEAKLYGHNATHALAAYLGAIRGFQRIAELGSDPGIMSFLRAAFIEESGEALIRKHGGIDPLFTRAGYAEYADDLLGRMVNPFLGDAVERVGRDPERKLAWDDRLVGTMRIALRMRVLPRRYAVGAAAALATWDRSALTEDKPVACWLEPLWDKAKPEAAEKGAILSLIEDGRQRLRRWISGSDLDKPPVLNALT